MRKTLLVFVFLVLVAFGFFYWNGSKAPSNMPLDLIKGPKVVDFTARFEIFTRGTRRIFTDPKYHNLSPRVYIQNPDPGLIYVKEEGVTWNEFFKTLPMSLTRECLITGSGQTFCASESEKIRFTLNNIDTPEALDLKIVPNDSLVVRFE